MTIWHGSGSGRCKTSRSRSMWGATMVDAATEAQNRASEPLSSTWLSANAGSGKTKVLTDRVARLLLNDVAPQHILCLTYTKAAASEDAEPALCPVGQMGHAA